MSLPAQTEGASDFHALIKGISQPTFVTFQNPESPGTPADPTSIALSVFDEGDTEIATFTGSNLTKMSTGVYRFDFDAKNTFSNRNYLLHYTASWTNRISTADQALLVRPARVYRLLPYLRNQIDKAVKSTSLGLAYGYEERHLVAYMDLGVTLINIMSPMTSFLPENFPEDSIGLLIEASMITALDSQGIFAIDADIDYSLGGNAIRVAHYGEISQHLGSLVGRFNADLKVWKQQFRMKGKLLVGTPFSFAISRFLQVVPSGYFDKFGVSVGKMTSASGVVSI